MRDTNFSFVELRFRLPERILIMRKHLFIFILLSGLSSHLWAKDSPQFAACMSQEDAAQGVHPAMRECESAEIAYHDKRMNVAYQQLMKKLPAAKRHQLRQQQRVWMRQRDQQAQKAFEDAGSGQAGQLNSDGVLHSMTDKRADELESRLKLIH